ncbi:MAG: hypothetical protein JWN62_3332 [Acidimicrobiales bacterium]|nr:hypothetical protein [Acidimicrobiales bacterium]
MVYSRSDIDHERAGEWRLAIELGVIVASRAISRAAAVMIAICRTGRWLTWIASSWSTKASQSRAELMTPTGRPITSPLTTMEQACHAMVDVSCWSLKPSVRSTARSWLLLRTDATSATASAVAAMAARRMATSNGVSPSDVALTISDGR